MNSDNHFVAIDFETATASLNSACAIGIVEYCDFQEIDRKYYLIQPPANYYYNSNIAIHHITPDDTKNCNTFEKIWPLIEHYFAGQMVVAHNASFDINVLNACLEFYQIEKPEFTYFCSIQMGALGYKSPGIRKGLSHMAFYYGIELESHHNALCDAKASGDIIIHVQKQLKEENLKEFLKKAGLLKEFSKNRRFRKSPVIETIDTNKIMASEISSDFKGKTFAFTGEMPNISRPLAYTLVITYGGHISETVSSKVDVLVNADSILTNKLKNALALQKRGHHISIIGSKQFEKMVEAKKKEA